MDNEEALDLITDVPISDLESASKINPSDLFVLEQDGVAKKLSGQLLISYVMSLMGGHGSITNIVKTGTNGLVDSYSIVMEDKNTFSFDVTNGNGIKSVEKTSTDGLEDTYTITFDNGNKIEFTVKNGEKGDKGDPTYVWIKYASQMPTEESPSFGDIPDAWMGIATGHEGTAPTDWKKYKWNKVLGHEGPQGKPPQHYWTGTVLTIVSASGTSSADLRGDRGIPGKIQSINGYEPDPLTGDMTLGAGHKIKTDYQKLMDSPVTFVSSLAIVNGLGTAQIVAGRLYHITWGSTLYECRAQMYGGSVCLGNLGYFGGDDTGEPFVFEVTADTYCSVTKSNSNRQTINVKIELPASMEVIPIPKEYMPTDLYTRIAALEAKVGI